MSSEERELELCGKVEMRIALANDDKLELLLESYLAPLILKLSSEHVSVRNKIRSFQYVNILRYGLPEISELKLLDAALFYKSPPATPVASILRQYKENASFSMVRQFDLMFIQQSIGKLSPKEQNSLIPIIILGLASDYRNPTCSVMFNLFLRLLSQFQIPQRASKEDSALRCQLGFDKNNDDAKFIATWLGKLILLVVSPPSLNRTVCPGLTCADYEFLTLNCNHETWDPNSDKGLNLTQTKSLALNFLSSGAFTDEERFLPAFFASGDSNSRISNIGDDLIKRSTVSLENPEIISNLLDKYFTLKPALQTRLLILLSKSAISTTFTSQIIKIVQEAIHPEDNTNLPTQGLENVKFRIALLNYINWVSRIASKEDCNRVAPCLVGLLRSYIEDQGWPIPYDKSAEILSLRALGYETIGLLAKTSPLIIIENNLSLLRWLFKSVTEEGSFDDIFVSIEGALSCLLTSFIAPLEIELAHKIRSLLLEYMTLEEGGAIVRTARFTAVRWANHCLEYDDIVGRWIDIIALGCSLNERNDVIEEGKKGLDPYLYQILNSSQPSPDIRLPDWKNMVEVLFTSKSLLENSFAANCMKTGISIDSVPVFGNFRGYKINSFSSAITYCRQILLLNALQKSANPFLIDANWERKIDVLFYSDRNSLNTIKIYMRSVDQDSLNIFLTAAFEGMIHNDGNGLPGCGKCFVDILSVAPTEAVGNFSHRAFELIPSINSNNADTRISAARAYGIIATHPIRDKNTVQNDIQKLLSGIISWESAIGADANKVHGCILTLGFVLSKISYYCQKDVLGSSIIKKSVSILFEMLVRVENCSIKEAVLNAIGQICTAGVLTSTQLTELYPDIGRIIEVLTSAAKKGDENAISTLGRLSLIYDEDMTSIDESQSTLSSILTTFFGLFDFKQIEVLFTVGEAITCAVACWDSDALILGLDIETTYIGRSKRKQTLQYLLQKLLRDCKNTKPSLKKASGIWLYSLIKNCGHLEEVMTRLRECQAAFMNLLSSRDELVQETASRGLSLVYEKGDKSLKERLVKDLVSSFTGSGTQLKVDEDTELFEPGVLPTEEGNSVTSYRDIISLANEVGDQSLVYKFMSLASNAVTWSTRAAFGRFGLSNILSESEIDPKLYPKLYRYRFDPNPNVRHSMNDIWKALVKDSTIIINLYFEDILNDLLKNVLGKEWRTRQASCAALADLVQGHEFEKYEKYLHEIWHVAFKVLDDIKGSVRETAQSLSVVLTNILVRQVETGTMSKHAQFMLKEVLPFLLSEQGMESSAQDVRAFATITVIRLIKHGGKALLPFVPDLVEKLLGLLSTIEPEEINYFYQRAAEHRDKIDQIRSSAVSQSPLMEAIECCLDLVDEPTMKKLAPRLKLSVKTMIGMPSKIGCAHVLTSLVTRHSFTFRSFADSFLQIMESAVLDRNNTVSVAFAKASGFLSRLASNEALSDLAAYVRKLYFNAENENRRQLSGEIIYAISKFASDRFNSMASEFLPFVFFACHDLDNEVKQQFKKIWEDNVGGSRTVMLYSNEITKLSVECLECPKWTTKHTAALTISGVIQYSGPELSEPAAVTIWPALEKALALKTFDGKEKVLQAFIKLIESSELIWKTNATISHQMKNIIIREAKRNNLKYRLHSFDALGGFSEARRDIDMFEDVFQIIQPTIEEFIIVDRMDTSDEKTDNVEETNESAVLLTGISSLFRALNVKIRNPMLLMHLSRLVKVIQEVLHSSKETVAIKVVIYERTKQIFDDLITHMHPPSENQYDLLQKLFANFELDKDFGNEVVRLKRAEACEAIVHAFVAGAFGLLDDGRADCIKFMTHLISLSRANELSPTIRIVLEKCLSTLG